MGYYSYESPEKRALKIVGGVILGVILVVLFVLALGPLNESINNGMIASLERQGYSNVQLTGHAWGAGADSDTFAENFTAVINGRQVEGIITGGPIKGYTVRFR